MAFFVCLIVVSFPFYACADVLFGKSYHKTIHTYLKEADTSITVAMYFIILEPDGEGPINELVADLVDAKKRGVQVIEYDLPKRIMVAYKHEDTDVKGKI